MNLTLATRLLGWLLLLIAGLLLIPTGAALLFGESPIPYAISALVPALIGLPVALLARPASLRLRPRDGVLIVSAAWIAAGLFGALPFVATGVLNARFGTLLAAMHVLVLSLLGACALTGSLTVRWGRLARFAVTSGVVVGLTLVGSARVP